MEKDTEERIVQLETKLAYLEDFLNQLQSVAVENSTTIEKLREENRLMAQKIRDMSDQMEGDIPNRRPPHY
ncbi:MAG: SlyX family protein [Treponema sp.]|nr:SlyX family protein [Candidatus Treponema equi]